MRKEPAFAAALLAIGVLTFLGAGLMMGSVRRSVRDAETRGELRTRAEEAEAEVGRLRGELAGQAGRLDESEKRNAHFRILKQAEQEWESKRWQAARDTLKAQGARVLGDGEPKIGAHGKPVLFLHPKDFCGTLVELEQA